MNRYSLFLLTSSILILLAACDRFEGDVTEPSFLKINDIIIVDNPSDSWSYEDGFFTSDVDAVNVVIYVDGDTAETNLGTFQLPCEIPVLRNGNIDRVIINPIVRQDGIAGKRIFYPYYEPITLTNITLNTDMTTDLGTLTTRYIPKGQMFVPWSDFFEPPITDFSLDSVVVPCINTDTACSGYGCGVVHVSKDQSSVSFGTDTTYQISDPSAYVYLEMEYWSNLDFSIGLNNPSYVGGPNKIKSHMTIYGKPEKGWQKIYINLGALWTKEYNSYEFIRPYFTILNESGKGGDLFIDNIKLVVIY